MRLLGLILPVYLIVYGGLASAQEETKPAAPAPQQSPQPSTDAPADKSKVVYVSDFDLDVPNPAAEKNGGADKNAPSSIPAAAAAQPDEKKQEGPAEQARKLVDTMSSTLVQELEKAGYTAHRMRPGQTRPEEGIQVKGVFTEPDEENHLRRAVIGDGSVGKMALFVGIGNLARPDQPLYSVVDLKGSENGENEPGAMINVSAYAPVAKFEMQKNATEKAVKDTAAAIVADLTVLLNTNIAAATP